MRAGPELVSVIISAFNSESYIDEAISSAVDQDWAALDVVVSDDGSTDRTLARARGFGSRVTIVEGSDEGVAATRNRGMSAARGAYFLHLDADDLLLPGAIRTLMDAFGRDDSCDIVVGRMVNFVSPELPPKVASRFTADTEPQRGHLSGVSIARADVFDRAGRLDEGNLHASEIEWWTRACDSRGIRIQHIDDVVLQRRIHGNNASLRNSRSHSAASLAVVRAALRRRREGTS